MKNKIIIALSSMLITILVALLIGIISIYFIFIAPYYKNQVAIVDKPDLNIEDTIDVILPEINDDEKEINKLENMENISKELSQPFSDVETYREKEQIYKEVKLDNDIINIILTGMDARSYDVKSRSDSIILASYNTINHTVKLVSFMRDSWIYIPDKGWSRINAATAYGGTGMLINTINHNFDLDIQNYIEIKFEDFKKVIDILGGIDLELDKKEINYINKKLHNEDRDWDNDIESDPGITHLNGAQALWHCRNRSVGNSDFTRTERQRTALIAIINKALTMDIQTATQMIYEMKDYVNTNIPISTLIDIATAALIEKDLTIESQRIPYDGMYWSANKNGASVLEIDIEKNKEALHDFLGYRNNPNLSQIQEDIGKEFYFEDNKKNE